MLIHQSIYVLKAATHIKLNTNLPEADYPLLGSSTTALDHDIVLVDLTIVREATHWRDGLLGEVILSGCIILDNL